MKRDYSTGETDSVNFFFGREVEHTPAYGMDTLFVTGIQTVKDIEQALRNAETQQPGHYGISVKHIFFGANHSFNPSDYESWKAWEGMIQYFLDKGFLCSLDIPMSAVEEFNDGGLNEYHNFIPQIRVPIPYIKLWNYNTMLKIDDKDFKATNPGVWSHSLHELQDRSKFTSWDKYKGDTIL